MGNSYNKARESVSNIFSLLLIQLIFTKMLDIIKMTNLSLTQCRGEKFVIDAVLYTKLFKLPNIFFHESEEVKLILKPMHI